MIEVDNDLRSGGRAFNVMRLPDGQEIRNEGCFQLAGPARRLVFTDALQAGFRPNASAFMCCDLHLTAKPGGTLYACTVMHRSTEDRMRHEEMGFFDGWGTTLQQLGTLAMSI